MKGKHATPLIIETVSRWVRSEIGLFRVRVYQIIFKLVFINNNVACSSPGESSPYF